jgi:hypothetical protein
LLIHPHTPYAEVVSEHSDGVFPLIVYVLLPGLVAFSSWISAESQPFVRGPQIVARLLHGFAFVCDHV